MTATVHPLLPGSKHIRDMTGQAFGRLRVTGLSGVVGSRRIAAWACVCACGAHCVVLGKNLLRGATISCGCDRKTAQHGHWRKNKPSSTWISWAAMKNRCSTPSHVNYRHYGGRGISVCQRWDESFAAFLADMGERPSTDHQIDRIDNDGNYEPGNCRWATVRQQGRNRRTNALLTHDATTLTMTEWSERTGIGITTIKERLRRGWTHEQALTAPVLRRKNGRRS